MKETKVLNMTEGKAVKIILAFSLPLMIGNVFQQLYTVVDTIVVGQWLGVNALAALGVADWTVWMVLGIVQGFAQGFSILMAQKFGAGDGKGLRRVVANSLILAAVIAVFALVASEMLIPLILDMLHAPELIRPMARKYLAMIFAAIPVVMAYNVFASILRALGDSRTPLHAMIVAALTNVALDVLFVIGFGFGIAGAAAGTIIAQGVSAVYCFVKLRQISELRLGREDFQVEAVLLGRLLYLGIPMAFMNAVIAIGGMVITSVVNGFGVAFIAGFTATNKIYGVLEIAAVSFGYAMTTFAGQNLGAGKLQRIKEGVRASLFIAILTSVGIAAVMLLFGKLLLSCFISGDPAESSEALKTAYYYLAALSCFLPILYILYVLRSCIQGTGNTIIPMASGIAEFLMRVIAALALPKLFGENGIFFAEVCAWLGADLVLVFCYFPIMKKLYKSETIAKTNQKEGQI